MASNDKQKADDAKVAKSEEKVLANKLPESRSESRDVDANAAKVETVEEDGVTSTLPGETLQERAEKVETPDATGNVRPLADPNGGPQSTPETYEEEAKQKTEAFERRETYLDINDPAHANKTYAQLQTEAGADVENMR